MSTTKPITFILVPGSFSGANSYGTVPSLLQAQNYSVVTPRLPSTLPLSEPATMAQDAWYIRTQIYAALDAGDDVVVAMNSYGGFPGTEACKGLFKGDREKEGKKNGVVGLVYIASFLPKAGDSITVLNGENSMVNDGSYMSLDRSMYSYVFSDLSEKDGKYWISQMTDQSLISFYGATSYAAWKYIPTTALVPGGDLIVPATKQMEMIEHAKSVGAEIIVEKKEGAGHVPMLSQPEWVVEGLVRVAEKL